MGKKAHVSASDLNDKERKQVVADYVESASYNATAKKWKISPTTVKKWVKADPKTAQKCEQKKEANIVEILAHMDQKKNIVCDLIDMYLDALLDKDRLNASSINQISTVLGTIIDKWTMQKAADNTIIVEHYIPGAPDE